MARITMTEQQVYPTLPVDTIVHLKVEDITVDTVNGARGSWEKLSFKFKLMGIQATGDGSDPSNYDALVGGFVYGSVPFRLTDSADNKLRQWVEALLGMELGVGFELDTDLLVRRDVRGVVSHYEKKKFTDPVTGLPAKGHQIESLLPKAGSVLSQAAPAAAVAAPVTPAASWDEPPF